MGATGVISLLVTVSDKRLWFLGRRSGRLGLASRRRGRLDFCRRGLVENFGQLVEDGITGQTQLAQNFSRRAHDFGHALRPDHYQRDGQDQNYFKRVQASMTVWSVRDSIELTSLELTSRGARKFHVPCPRQLIPPQLIIIKVRSVNDA